MEPLRASVYNSDLPQRAVVRTDRCKAHRTECPAHSKYSPSMSYVCASHINILFYVKRKRRLSNLLFPFTAVNVLIFLKILFILREGKGRRKRNINVWLPLMRPLLGTWPSTQVCTLTGNETSDPLVLRLALNPLSHTSYS